MAYTRYSPSSTEPAPTVLVVDDEAGIRKGCQRVLRAEGLEVLLAESIAEGLDLLRQRPDTQVALVDLKMPGGTGMEFLAAARAVAPETVCVMITAYATIETAVEATKTGAYDFLAKPFTPDELLRVVNKSLERAQLIRDRNRLQAERESRMLELATEQSRLRTIINFMADGVLVCNAQGELVLYNPAALRVLPQIQPGAEAYMLEDVLQPAELLELVRSAGAQRKRLSGEVQLTHLGEEPWVLADVAPVLDENSGRFLGTVTALRDITALKRVEQVKAQFVNMVAHELRSPLAAVDGYLSVMIEGLTTDPEKQRQMLKRSRERLKALLDLVGDLLSMARMEAGAVRREIADQPLGQVVADVAELMRPLAAERGLTVEVEDRSQGRVIEADREELIRLFNNLVSNAIKYNRQGGSVRIVLEPDGPYLKVSVTDTGVGISEEGLSRLFREFFREKTPQTAQVTGTGLGLSIVKRIVDFYHGRVEAQSELGKGSTFTVWLPAKQGDAGGSPESGAALPMLERELEARTANEGA